MATVLAMGAGAIVLGWLGAEVAVIGYVSRMPKAIVAVVILARVSHSPGPVFRDRSSQRRTA